MEDNPHAFNTCLEKTDQAFIFNMMKLLHVREEERRTYQVDNPSFIHHFLERCFD